MVTAAPPQETGKLNARVHALLDMLKDVCNRRKLSFGVTVIEDCEDPVSVIRTTDDMRAETLLDILLDLIAGAKVSNQSNLPSEADACEVLATIQTLLKTWHNDRDKENQVKLTKDGVLVFADSLLN